MGIVELKGDVLIIRQGADINKIVVEKKTAGDLIKKRPPKDAIKALLPLFEEAYDTYPELVSPEGGNWVKLRQDALFEPEKSINLLRRHGFGVEEVSESLMDMALSLGATSPEKRDKAKDIIRGWMESKIRELYASTTEVTGPKK